ncbi:MAG: hypothetical protein JWN16_1818 [Alphaproteobacteria bacterium]|nr:hypothetical protein [Alphaproteobacteria bacterium]
MKLPARGGFIIVLSLMVTGCVAPMTTREAQDVANVRLAKYCNKNCGAITMGRTQKIKDRWLVDFEGPRQKFTVTVEDNGNSKVTTWNK